MDLSTCLANLNALSILGKIGIGVGLMTGLAIGLAASLFVDWYDKRREGKMLNGCDKEFIIQYLAFRHILKNGGYIDGFGQDDSRVEKIKKRGRSTLL